ncbi:TetR family transcriptional regulator [Butyricicoccus sp. 1XD8-22]|nr:TetR family transcriptional regulator [Butyricicoccus sp. 1XD8-22]
MEGTRGAIIQAFNQLLDEKPISKITVKDIVGRCGINRNTFYYHFADIPELVDQIMEDMANQLVQNHFQPGQPIECIRPVVQYGLRNKNKLLHIYRYVSRETSIAYLNRIVLCIMQNYFDDLITDCSVSAENVTDLTKFYKCAFVGLLLDWLDGNMKDDMMALAQRLCILLHGTGKLALRR